MHCEISHLQNGKFNGLDGNGNVPNHDSDRDRYSSKLAFNHDNVNGRYEWNGKQYMQDLGIFINTYLMSSTLTTLKKMLWNWYTIDACFISSTWQVTSRGMFAGSCIGIVFLVISLEFLRRLQREYDQYIAHQRSHPRYQQLQPSSGTGKGDNESGSARSAGKEPNVLIRAAPAMTTSMLRCPGIQPSALQQLVRAGIHMLQFGVAYFIMLLAMYYNGYIIICILIGAFLGSYIFNWEIAGRGSE